MHLWPDGTLLGSHDPLLLPKLPSERPIYLIIAVVVMREHPLFYSDRMNLQDLGILAALPEDWRSPLKTEMLTGHAPPSRFSLKRN
jgi:hypothetical protein